LKSTRLNIDNRLESLAKIAEMYFAEGLSQEQIAARTNYSRSMVSRLLTEARAQGVVEIRIHHPLGRLGTLEQALTARFGLKLARVLDRHGLDDEQARRRLGALAARTIEDQMQDGQTIGVSWGRALAEAVQALRPQPRTGMHIVQLLGSLGSRLPALDGAYLARQLAGAVNGQYHTLSAPLLVASERVRNALVADPVMRDVFDRAAVTDLALLGVGSVDPRHSALVQAGFVSTRESQQLLALGAVGDVCALHIDAHGAPVAHEVNRRVVGVSPEILRRAPMRLGVAGGGAKGVPILAAIRAGMINALVTDEQAAAVVLAKSRLTDLSGKDS
jgi:DNA-binding transcriptional regulator LsrR (DeoR family)